MAVEDKEFNKAFRRFCYRSAIGNEKKSEALMFNVYDDLNPFRTLITNLINNNSRISEVSADVEPIDVSYRITPEFKIITVPRAIRSVFRMPKGHYYLCDFGEDYNDDFEIRKRKTDVRLTSENMLDYYDGHGVFYSESELPDGKYTLEMDDYSDPRSIELHEVDFVSDYRNGAFRIESKTRIHNLAVLDDGLEADVDDESIMLFGKIQCERIESSQSDNSDLTTAQGYPVKMLDQDIYLVQGVKFTLIRGSTPVEYSNIDLSRYPEILNDCNIIVKGSYLAIGQNTGKTYISNHGARFKVSASEDNPVTRYPEGVFIQLKDNDSYRGEIYGSSSFFFREDVSELSDRPVTKGVTEFRKFGIGKKFEDTNIIEIFEYKQNKRVKPINIPDRLHIIYNSNQLRLQQQAINTLIFSPSPHHAPLLKLMDGIRDWQPIDLTDIDVSEWYVLKDDGYDGVDKQRKMVRRSLNTPDFAFLEGPPGSGKTTTILEIIAQLIMNGNRVLLAASTHAAIDNILERLPMLPQDVRNQLLPIRVGREDSINEQVKKYMPDCIEDPDLRSFVESNANLVCGTTYGILNHKDFNLKNYGQNKYIPALFDYLIIDEASKTTFQDFLVPALFARRWILSGDIRQLTPYIEQEDIASMIRQMDSFDENTQDALGLIQNLTINLKNDLEGYRFTIPLSKALLPHISDFMPSTFTYTIISDNHGISRDDVLSGSSSCFQMYGSDFIFVEDKVLDDILPMIPESNILLRLDMNTKPDFHKRVSWYYSALSRRFGLKTLKVDKTGLSGPDSVAGGLNNAIRERTWSKEIAWRVVRQQELFMLDSEDNKIDYSKQISDRVPSNAATNIDSFINMIRELSMPSILQLLKQGVRRDMVKTKRDTTLNSGFGESYQERMVELEFQGRMHPDISKFPREQFYNEMSLKDSGRLNRNWNYNRFGSRAVWINTYPKNGETCSNENREEINRIISILDDFKKFTASNPRTDSEPWTVGILTYYRRQEKLLVESIADWAGSTNRNRRTHEIKGNNLRVETYSVDKYQGKEADMIIISMVKSGRKVGLGFMDSPNRLNVALTRARYQRIIVGDCGYFKRCKSGLLRKLAEESYEAKI